MALLVLGQALPARVAIEDALDHGRYGINADSQAAPRPDPRTCCDQSVLVSVHFGNAHLGSCVSARDIGPRRSRYGYRPYIELLYGRYSQPFS